MITSGLALGTLSPIGTVGAAITVCVTDPTNVTVPNSLYEGDCGPEKSWVEVEYHRPSFDLCINTRIDNDIPFCNPPPPPSNGTCPTEGVFLSPNQVMPVSSPGGRHVNTFALASPRAGEFVSVAHRGETASPGYARLLHRDAATGACSFASWGDAENGNYASFYSGVTFLFANEESLDGTYFLQVASWDEPAPMQYTVGRDVLVTSG